MSGSGASSDQTGSIADMVARMRAVLPCSWFPITPPGATVSSAPVLDGLLSGIGWAWSYCHALANYTIQQARIGTATGGFLDMICTDFFGSVISRLPAETDDSLRARVRANLLLAKATRSALSGAVETVSGRAPLVFEPNRAADTGGYGGALTPGAGGGGGYGSPMIGYGSDGMPFQYLVTVLSEPSRTTRSTAASYVDGSGAIQIAAPGSVRRTYSGGLPQGALLEPRGFNLIKDSVGWSLCQAAPTGAPAWWFEDPSGTGAIWAGQPVLQITVASAGSFVGPSLPAWTDVGPVTGSVWLLLPAKHQITTMSLEIMDAAGVSVAVLAAVDLTVTGNWQRISATLPATGIPGRQISLKIIGAAVGATSAPVLTQCWQIEQGSSASSYIPSHGQVGFRDADQLVVVDALPAQILNSYGLQQAIDGVIPAASIAWTTVRD